MVPPPDKWSDDASELHRQLVPRGYGYGDAARFHAMREVEYPALKDTTFLDHAASTPAPPSALLSFHTDISRNLYSNPHSRSPSGIRTADKVETLRTRVLTELCGLDEVAATEWDVVWTSGATQGCKIVGECFSWERDGENGARGATFTYAKESHTSLVGIRELALSHNANVTPLSTSTLLQGDFVRPTLLAYPAACNATGTRLGLELCRQVKRASPSTAVLVDAASWLSTTPLSLGSIPLSEAPDFIVCSLYKIFGWPTGLGCLIIRRSAFAPTIGTLSPPTYFGGSNVSLLTSVSHALHPLNSPPHLILEHGTLPFLDIIALSHAMDTHSRLFGSLAAVSSHTTTLASYARAQLSSLTHSNGFPLVVIHSSPSLCSTPSPTIGFSLLDHHGQFVGHIELERLATINGFELRAGGMCNTGAWTEAIGVEDEDLKRMWEGGRKCWDDQEFDPLTSLPLGIARISFGASSTLADVQKFVTFIRRFFTHVGSSLPTPLASSSVSSSPLHLSTLTIYPIKSCAPLNLSSSSLASHGTGLSHDRQFMLVSSTTGKVLSQKRYPRMVLIRSEIDEVKGVLRVRAPGMNRELVIPLSTEDEDLSTCEADMCGELVESHQVHLIGVSEWFTTFLGVSCSLHRASSSTPRHSHLPSSSSSVQPLLLSNESPFLLISSSSHTALSCLSPTPFDIACFRANFIVSGWDEPWVEDRVDLVRIGREVFQSLGKCRRCLMVGVDQKTGTKSSEPFNTLSRCRRGEGGRINFGVHMMWRKDLSEFYREGGSAMVRSDDEVEVLSWLEDEK